MSFTQDEMIEAQVANTCKKSGTVLTIGASSVKTAALDKNFYRVSATCACWVRVGATGEDAVEADASSVFWPEGYTDKIPVAEGDYVHAIQHDGSTGYLSVNPAR